MKYAGLTDEPKRRKQERGNPSDFRVMQQFTSETAASAPSVSRRNEAPMRGVYAAPCGGLRCGFNGSDVGVYASLRQWKSRMLAQGGYEEDNRGKGWKYGYTFSKRI
jgi:hypothetical protein